MGADGTSTDKSMSRPKFQWELRTAPWTNGRGPQDEYADAVDRWCDMHDLLDEKNPNKLSDELRGTMLWSQLVVRAKDVTSKNPKEVLMSTNGTKAVVADV